MIIHRDELYWLDRIAVERTEALRKWNASHVIKPKGG